MNEPDRWYARTPDTNLIPAIQNMSITDQWRYWTLRDIASQSETRWIITDSDEALRGPLRCSTVGCVREFLRYLVKNDLLVVLEDGRKILTRSALTHVADYPFAE